MLHNYGVEDNPGFGLVVHPPVGKHLIAFGEAMFGYTGLGWRFSSAVFGVILVALVVRIVRRISRSTLIGAIAGLLAVCDGVSFVAARTALLDNFMTVFVVAAFGALMVDRDQVRERMHIALLEGRIAETPWGPRLGVRWWRFGAGVLLGLACATKWSGLYFVVFFGLMSLALDVAARRAYRVPRPWTGVMRRDLGPTAWVFGLIPPAVYLLAYAPWFASETAVNRHEVGQSIGPRQWFQPPDAIRSLWHYTYKAYHFHSTLTNSAGNHHPWESKPWTWPMSLRPVLYAIDDSERRRLRAGVVRQIRHAHRHPVDVVARSTGAVLCVLAGIRPARLAVCGCAGGVLRGLAALVRRDRSADVLLLCGDDGTVPGHDDRPDTRRHLVLPALAIPNAEPWACWWSAVTWHW